LLNVLAVAAGVRRVPVIDVAEPDVVRPASVAERHVQVPVARAEEERSAVVVELRLVDLEDNALRRWVRSVRVRGGDAELGYAGCMVVARRRAGPQRRAVVDENRPLPA
jgi:hypothetical protein